MHKTKIGIIGCGSISWAYFDVGRRFEILEIAAVADLQLQRAQARAEEYSLPRACSVAELLADPEITLVVNLTPPLAHREVSLSILEAGKHLYSEKPLAVTRAQGREIAAKAAATGLRVGCAPDTFLGAGLQTARKLIDEGAIGRPLAASANLASHGPEHWHPDPAFHYRFGGGPLMGTGPYYLTALVHLLGPVASVFASTTAGLPERLITSQPHYGERVKVEVPTHVTGVLRFATGEVATLLCSFDIWASNLPLLEVYGTEGSLSLGDPNCFGGPVRLRRAQEDAWTDVPLTHPHAEQNRGIGTADLAYALRSGRPHRASLELAYHVLDIQRSLIASGEQEGYVTLESRCERPAMLPLGLTEGTLDE